MTDGTTEERVSVLVGDRLCTRCGYNLTGQPVLREPHYNLLIVRCPECAMIASLQEYPLLGRWVARWSALLAALWLLVMLAMFLASAGITFGFSQGVSHNASRGYARHLAGLQKAWLQEQEAQGATLDTNARYILTSPAHEFRQLDPDWVQIQDFDALFADAGGWLAVADFRALILWIGFAIVTFIIGCVWSVALLGWKRRSLPLAALAIVGLSCVFAAIVTFAQQRDFDTSSWLPATRVAESYVGAPFMFLSVAFATIPLSLGTLAGRSVARGLMRALLPPRMRGALAMLWICDGKTPPQA